MLTLKEKYFVESIQNIIEKTKEEADEWTDTYQSFLDIIKRLDEENDRLIALTERAVCVEDLKSLLASRPSEKQVYMVPKSPPFEL